MKRKVVLGLFIMSFCFSLFFFAGCKKEDEPKKEDVIIELSKKNLTLEIGQSETLTVSLSIEGLTVDWITSDDKVATVNQGKVTGIGEGQATIEAKSGTVSDSCIVKVIRAVPIQDPVITEEEGYDGKLSFSNTISLEQVDLKKGLSAKDSEGNELEIEITDMGGFNLKGLGTYTIFYKATDKNGRFATFEREVSVTYYGLDKKAIDEKKVSNLSNWTYVSDTEDAKTASEWGQQVVPGHSTNWNRFEGPLGMPCVVMHGSDTNGREHLGEEVDDEDPNTFLYNKVKISDENSIFRVFLSNNPYPDYNNLLSKVRVTVLDLQSYEATVIGGYREIKAPLNATKDGLDYEQMRNYTFEDFDLSAFIGKTILLCIEQDAPKDVYQWDYYKDIGYLDFQIQPLIAETRDTLVIYSMKFIKEEDKIDTKDLVLDDETIWGTEESDMSLWGLRGDEAAKAKWKAVFLNGGTGLLNFVTGTGASLQLIAYEAAGMADGALRLADAALINKVNVGKNSFFEIYVGTDSDLVNVNYRLSFILENGKKVSLSPLFIVDGYTPLGNHWATIQKSQWTTGVKLIYDVSDYQNQTLTIAIEVDENAEAGVGNCTLWINKIRFVETMTFSPADYSAYNALKEQVISADYQQDQYTEMSWSIFTEALNKFNSIPSDLVNEQQSDIDSVTKQLQDAILLLTKKPEPITPPADSTDGILEDAILDFDDSAWKLDEVDPSGVWGTDATMGEYWGLRGDTLAKSAWNWYIGDGNGNLIGANILKMGLQSIAYEQGNDTEEEWNADALFANKVWVRGIIFRLYVGCDDGSGSVNIRVRVIKKDGEIVTLEAMKFNDAEVDKAKNGWYTLHVSQWIYGTCIVYDFSEYKNEIVTILIEQDQNEEALGTSCTLWFNKAEFVDSADYTAYEQLRAELEEKEYKEEDYTEESYAEYSKALLAFQSIPLNLSKDEQAELDEVVANLISAIAGLVKNGEVVLEENVLGFTTSEWKALETDESIEWGDDNADAGLWGLRGEEDLENKKKWKYFPGANASLNHLENAGASLQSISWETDQDINGISVDALFVNKVFVTLPIFSIYVGCDTENNFINLRVRIVLEDGTFVILNPIDYVQNEYTPLVNGWGTIQAGQWVYGTKISFDFSAYLNQTVTILIEQDAYDNANPTLWLNRLVFKTE